MSEPYVLGSRARCDLAAIADFIDRESGFERARWVVLSLRRRFRQLALFSAVGHRREDLTKDENVRFWVVHPYLVVFVPATKPLFIARILHGSRDPDDLRQELQRPKD